MQPMREGMGLWLVAYEMVGCEPSGSGRRSHRIEAVISGMGGEQILSSQWALRSDLSAAQLRDQLSGQLRSDDRLMVVELCGAWASLDGRTTDAGQFAATPMPEPATQEQADTELTQSMMALAQALEVLAPKHEAAAARVSAAV